MSKKEKAEELKEKLFMKKENCWDIQSDEKDQIFDFAEGYKHALNIGKTERRFIAYSVEQLEKAGFQDISQFEKLNAGDKVYTTMHDKTLIAAIVGEEEPSKGFNMVGSHVDSPRLDLKPNPLMEEEELVYFKTHYYGGIKKYQWLSTALSLHGVIYLSDGKKVEINVGDDPQDPVFTITDLLPHLDKHLRSKKVSEFVNPEKMNLLIGSIPYPDTEVKDRFKLGILNLLNEQYGLTEIDFNRAEIEIVPAQMARDVGFDRSMIGAYGQDDRVCAYTSLEALINSKAGKRTIAILFADKEEIGSEGNTGAQSEIFLYQLNHLHEMILGREPKRREIEEFYMNTNLLSSDVSNVFDPNYAEVSDPLNSSYLSKGIGINKYTGAAGKSSTNDAHAEFVSYVLNIFAEHNIPYQISELGKVDWGGGGTIAKYFAKTGMNVIDSGVAMFAMHSCFEITSKIDVYNTYRAYLAFLNN